MRWAQENDFDAYVDLASQRSGVPVALLKAVIGVESGFDPMAYNPGDPGGAWGLMQMLPATARGLGYTGPMADLQANPALAIDLGSQLLAQNMARVGGAVADSVSAYNGGFRPALGFGAVLPGGQYGNQDYVSRVLDAYTYFLQGSPSGGGGAPPGTSFPSGPRGPAGVGPHPSPPKVAMNLETILLIAKQLFDFIHAQASDPIKDRERIARIDQGYALAQVHDETPQANLDHRSGRAYIDEIVTDAPTADGGSESGSKIAWAYARLKQEQLRLEGNTLA